MKSGVSLRFQVIPLSLDFFLYVKALGFFCFFLFFLRYNLVLPILYISVLFRIYEIDACFFIFTFKFSMEGFSVLRGLRNLSTLTSTLFAGRCWSPWCDLLWNFETSPFA